MMQWIMGEKKKEFYACLIRTKESGENFFNKTGELLCTVRTAVQIVGVLFLL